MTTATNARIQPATRMGRALRAAAGLLLVAVLASPTLAFGQFFTQPDFLLLRIPSSPYNASMGGTGVALPSTDASAAFYNPAQRGFFARHANVAVQSYPSEVRLSGRSDLNHTALNVGYDLRTSLGVPVSIGAGFMSTSLNTGGDIAQVNALSVVGGFLAEQDRYSAFGLSAGLDAFIDVYAGVSLKRIVDQRQRFLNVPPPQDPAPGQPVVIESGWLREQSETYAWDFGVMAVMPVSEWLAGADAPGLALGGAWTAALDLSLGYAALNVGDEATYRAETYAPLDRFEGLSDFFFFDQSAPLPRTALLGYAASLGLDVQMANRPFRVAAVEWTVEAEDDLTRTSDVVFFASDPNGLTIVPGPLPFEGYQGPLGNINLWDNVIAANGSREVARHWGASLELAETLRLSRGDIEGGGFSDRRTTGFGLRSRGLFRLLAARAESDALRFTARHLDLRYDRATYENPGSGIEASIQSVALVVRGF